MGIGLGKKFEGSVSTCGLVINGWLHFLYQEGFSDGQFIVVKFG